MSDLAQIESIRNELRVDDVTGKTTVSLRGMAKIAGVSHGGLIDHVKSARSGQLNPSKLVQTLIDKGFDVVSWNEEGVPDTAVVHILEYFAYEAQKVSETALRVYRTVAAIGARKLFQQVLGYQERTQMSQVLDILQTLVSKVDKLEAEVTDFHNLKSRTERHEGLFKLNEAMTKDSKTRYLPAAPITASEWLRNIKHVELDDSLLSRFYTELALAYSTLNNGKLPQKVKGVCVYMPQDYNIMELTLQQLNRATM